MPETLLNIFHLIFSENFILTVVTASTPLLLASSGELVVERSGVLNLGVEGMMIVGAACGFGGAWLSVRSWWARYSVSLPARRCRGCSEF